MSKEKHRIAPTYPQPLVIGPESISHSHTFILLHGRGSYAETFGHALLDHPAGRYGSLREAFPHAKFIFPTAAFRRATIYKRTPITQWFDNWHLTEPAEREDLQVEGLRESCGFLYGLIDQAIAEVGPQNIVVGGLSQGCATLLVARLLWKGEALGAWFGMCGWLPFRQRMQEALQKEDDDQDDLFERDDEAQTSTEIKKQLSPMEGAVMTLREELELPSSAQALSSAHTNTPIFLGHGVLDDRVPVQLGREAKSLSTKIGMDVTWKEYEGLGHWYSAEMIEDIIEFLKERLGNGSGKGRIGANA